MSSSDTESPLGSPPTPPKHNPSILQSASHFITLKLTIDNYLLWKAQIVPFLKGHQLYGYVDRTLPKPPSTINAAVNPAYTRWLLQDQLIISAINSSLSNNVLSHVLECTTSHEVLTTLQNLFAAQSSAHVVHIQYQLATLKKGSESISKYYQKAISLAASLGAAGHPVSQSQFSIYLLAGLGSDYESIVTSITTRPEPLSSHQIYSFLLNHESRLTHQHQSLTSGTNIAAYPTSFRPPSSASNSTRGRNQNHRGGRRGRGRGGQFPNQFSTRSDTRPLCQVCHKHGHTAISCYHRFNQSYQAPAPPSFTAHFTSMPPTPSPSPWFPDTAATNHFTADFSNLNLDSTPYQGTDQVSIGVGSSIPIQNVGSAHINTPNGFANPSGSSSGNR
ncbi:hypothetical protein F2P56_027145 [Juglans regia]|uniref:Retrotransposon Copia-like N-terminal domain-containing protein n=1 Tax=Juglans regia TaxID=51240 RepID=A0A833U6A8_JUGRE|nr:hypothetical protein F2P56_027145 [Juglans regia]